MRLRTTDRNAGVWLRAGVCAAASLCLLSTSVLADEPANSLPPVSPSMGLQLKEATSLLERATELVEEVGRHLERLGRDRDAEGATRLLEQAIALEPGFPRPYAYMAQVVWARGDPNGMVGWLERGVQADPDSWRIRRTLARALVATGRIREAEPHARRAVELFGDDVGGRLLLALVLYAEGKYDEYAQHTEFALRFVAQFRHDLPDVRSFLQSHRRFGPGRSLPPAPDPRLIMGWNQD